MSRETLIKAKRILVLGPCGAGKSYLAGQLAPLLDLEAIHLDAQFWKPGWRSTPQGEWRRTVGELIERERWIMDGTYESTLDLRIPAADAIIYVHDWTLMCLWRVLMRLRDRGRPRRDAPPGQRLDWPYLRYILRFNREIRPQVIDLLNNYGAGKPLIQVRGSREVRRLIASLERR